MVFRQNLFKWVKFQTRLDRPHSQLSALNRGRLPRKKITDQKQHRNRQALPIVAISLGLNRFEYAVGHSRQDPLLNRDARLRASFKGGQCYIGQIREPFYTMTRTEISPYYRRGIVIQAKPLQLLTSAPVRFQNRVDNCTPCKGIGSVDTCTFKQGASESGP